MTLLLCSTALAGVAAALGYRDTLQTVNELAPSDRRAELISTYLLACYSGIALPVVGIDLVADATNLDTAMVTFAGMIIVLALVALIGRLRHSSRAGVRA